VLLGGDRHVRGRHELVGDVAHEQRSSPAVAADVAGDADDRMIDDVGGNVHQAGLPDAQRPTSDVARDAHREVVVEGDVLEHEAIAVDGHALEARSGPGVVGTEGDTLGGTSEQLLHRVEHRAGREAHGRRRRRVYAPGAR